MSVARPINFPGSSNFSFRSYGLSEAIFDDQKREVSVTVIKAGWSKNGLHYPQTVLESIGKFIAGPSRKVYIDHHPDGVKGSRKVSEWIATVQEAHVEGDELKARIKVHADGPNSWVYDRMKSDPSVFGPSIVGVAEVGEGTADGIKGKIVNSIKYIRSFDIVAEPAAGGKIDGVIEGVVWDSEKELSEASPDLSAYVGRLKEREKEQELRNDLWTLLGAFECLVNDLVLAREDYEYISIADRQKIVDSSSAEFAAEVNKLSFIEPEPAPDAGTTTSEEGKKASVSEDTKTGKPIINPKKEITAMTLEEMKKDHPELLAAYALEVKEELETKAVVAASTKLSEEVKTLREQVGKIDGEKVALLAENKALKEQNDKTAKEVAESTRKGIIAEEISKAKLPDFAVTDSFKESLDLVPFTMETKEEFTKKVTALCEDRKTLAEKVPSKKISTGPVNTPPEKKEVKESADEKYPTTNADFAKKFGVK